RRHNTNNLPVRGTRIYIVDFERALNRVTHGAYGAVGIGGQTLWSLAGFTVASLNHVGWASSAGTSRSESPFTVTNSSIRFTERIVCPARSAKTAMPMTNEMPSIQLPLCFFAGC